VCACKGRDRRTSEPALPCLEQQGQAPMPASGSCCVYPHFFWARRGRPLGPALGPPLGRVASFFALVTRARHCGRAQAATSTTSGAPGMHFREGCAVAHMRERVITAPPCWLGCALIDFLRAEVGAAARGAARPAAVQRRWGGAALLA